ncbi:UNVERIFIED_CONTAM: hypothetical protein B566_EDAN018373 [Ephemera danica]|nr:hypothetical protein B566_EDAN018373 [Ephemera danica]
MSTSTGDRVICFQCGLGLKDWCSEDEPHIEHERWQNNCPFLKLVMAKNNTKKKNGCSNELQSLRCKHCLIENIDTVILPCGHMSFCSYCMRTEKKCWTCEKDVNAYNGFVEKLQQAAEIVRGKSCKQLVENFSYVILQFEKYESQFGGERLLATILDVDGETKTKVYLPSRIPAELFGDDEIATYNAGEPSLKLVYKGMLGRAINITITPL